MAHLLLKKAGPSLPLLRASPSLFPVARNSVVSGIKNVMKGVLKKSYPEMKVSLAGVSPTVTHSFSNGLLAASEEISGPWTVVGAIIQNGPRYERPDEVAHSYFLNQLIFKNSQAHSHQETMRRLEALGGNFACIGNRDTTLVYGLVFNEHVPESMEMLSQFLINPRFLPEDIELQKDILAFELQALHDRPADFVSDLIQEAAFGRDRGYPSCLTAIKDPFELKITAESLHAYHKRVVAPNRMVLSGAGIPSNEFLGLAEKHFAHMAPVPISVEVSPKYTGGIALHKMKESPVNNPLHVPLSYFALGFESPVWGTDDVFVAALVQNILGGGGSFSAGGPGKGLYSRFYSHVLNRHHWIESARAICVPYLESGLFTILGSCPPDHIEELAVVLLTELVELVIFVGDEEFTRAKNQVKSSCLMNLESRVVVFEDITRQLLSSKVRLSAKEMCDKIDAITKKDLTRVVKHMLSSAPVSVSGYGNLDKLPSYDVIQAATTAFVNKISPK